MPPRFLPLIAAAALLCASACGRAAESGVDTWRLCPAGADPLPPAPQPSRADYAPGTTEISADAATLVEHGVSTLTGAVEVTRDGQSLRADVLRYSDDEQWLEARDHATYWSNELFWSGARAHWDLATDIGTLQSGDFRLPQLHGRGSAAEAIRDTRGAKTLLRDVAYTTCPIGEEAWRLDAAKLTLDHAAEWGVARDVVVHVGRVPVFYSPYLSFPLSDRRKSGFLWPIFGTSSTSGTELGIPYYWNIAPERDATLTPRYFDKRGAMLGAEYRYLMRTGEGRLNVEWLPNDDAHNDDDRSFLSFSHRQRFLDDTLSTYLLYNRVSDREYFEDFGNEPGITSQRFLERLAEVTYVRPYWYAIGRVQSYQTVDRTLPGAARPYERLPQLLVFAQLPGGGDNRLNFRILGEGVYFDRPDSIVGTRVDLRPSISLPLRNPSAFLTPTLTLRYTQYLVENAPGLEDDPNRVVPVASVDSGLFFDRDLQLGRGRYLQTLEPRLFYLYVPYRRQDELPVFDTGQYDFTFDQLFREDRFSGPDRVSDANQVALAVTSRLLDRAGGRERLRASIGQIYYFDTPDVTLPGSLPARDHESDLIAEVTGRPLRDLRARASLLWDPNNDGTSRATLGLRYQPAPDRVINADYRVRKDIRGLGNTDVEQTDFSLRWPVTRNLGVVARWVYSLRNGEHLDAFGGVEYEGCCWGIRAVARRFLGAANGEYENGFFVQFELKGLAGIGTGADTFLERNLPGYTRGF